MIAVVRKPERIVCFMLREWITLAEVFEPVQAVAAAEDQIEPAAAGEIDRNRIEAKTGVIVPGDEIALPRTCLAIILIAINALWIELARVGAFMRAEAAADDQLGRAIAI